MLGEIVVFLSTVGSNGAGQVARQLILHFFVVDEIVVVAPQRLLVVLIGQWLRVVYFSDRTASYFGGGEKRVFVRG